LRFHHRPAGEIFRRNQFDIFALPSFFRLNRVKNSGSTCAIRRWERRGLTEWDAKCRSRYRWKHRRYARRERTATSLCSTKASTLGKAFLIVSAAGVIDIASQANRVRHVAPAGRAGFFKFTQQERLVGCIWKKHLDCFDMCSSHGENMRRAFDECAGERLAPEVANFCPFLGANLNRMRAGRLSSHGVHSG
jgi:hypothetical protein